MKRIFTYFVVFLLPFMHVFAVENVLFVAPDGTGDGSSWANASSLTAAAEVARVQEVKPEIWVKEGTYVFTDTINFDYLNIYGGFNGDETVLTERNWATNLTIFDGNNTVSPLRNTVGAARPGGNTTVIPCILDGVIVQNALSPTYANGGGMIINNGAVIRNCIFRNNATQGGKHGAAIHCNTNTIVIENCLFINNTSVANGGAIQIGGGTTVTARSCTFANNKAVNPGGAIGVGTNTSHLTLINSIAYNNLYGSAYNSFGGASNINAGGTIISKHSAVESTSTKFTNGDEVNHIILDRAATVPVVPGFAAPASVIGKGVGEAEITEINNASYRLSSQSSPCVNTGLNAEVTTIFYDLDYRTRIFADVVDMGVYESVFWPTGISQESEDNFKAVVSENELHVSGAMKGEKVQLFDLQGKLLNTVIITDDNEVAKFRLLNKGVYLVAGQNKLIKINY
ncbi:MAG: hypothetical protein VB066_02750 [Paludibacter sp.]|nr:hypothetical protein [Paludibacter sp.]